MRLKQQEEPGESQARPFPRGFGAPCSGDPPGPCSLSSAPQSVPGTPHLLFTLPSVVPVTHALSPWSQAGGQGHGSPPCKRAFSAVPVAVLGGARLPAPGPGSALLSSSRAQPCVHLLPFGFPPQTLLSADLLAASPSLVTLPGSLLSLLPFIVTLTSTHPGPHLTPVKLQSDVEHLGRSSRVGRERDLPTARPLSSPTSRAPVFLWSPFQVPAPSAEPRVLPSTGPPPWLPPVHPPPASRSTRPISALSVTNRSSSPSSRDQ